MYLQKWYKVIIIYWACQFYLKYKLLLFKEDYILINMRFTIDLNNQNWTKLKDIRINKSKIKGYEIWKIMYKLIFKWDDSQNKLKSQNFRIIIKKLKDSFVISSRKGLIVL